MLDKTFRPDEAEGRLYAFWERHDAFACDPASAARPYTIMMPPPNVTGSLHMGHALTFTVQDVLIRHARRRGRDALWQPGMDHAGIATQNVVERQLADEGTDRHALGRDGFLERVWRWKAESGGTINRQLRRLGASADWPRERFTMDEGLSAVVRRVFVTLYRQGLIYRDKRLVNWDPKLRTAISDLEVEPQEVKGHLWHLRYPLKDDPDTWITVATTRPETMLGDTAVAVHPEDERYRHLIGKTVVLPLVGREIPIVADDYADPEQGSGAVKITPAHDFNDYEVGKRQRLRFINVLDDTARILEQAEVFHLDPETGHFSREVELEPMPAAYSGLDRRDARKQIVADLEAKGLLDRVDAHTHAVPYGDRGGVPIEPWLTEQWYCDAHTLAQPAIQAVEQGRTRFVPGHWGNVYFDWMRNIQPWCISRQLWWGHRIPAWYGPDGTVFVSETEAEAQAEADGRYGRRLPLSRDDDVLDTWFSSALWPFSTLGWPQDQAMVARYYPGDVLVTAFDIIFFWVARMMMMGLHFAGDVPFAAVYIHALVRDEKGQKMSKSKGNVIDPLVLMDRYGADALRFTLMSMAAQGRDIKLSEGRVEGYRNFATKLWNAARYCEMNDCHRAADLDPAAVQAPVNRWILSEAAALTAAVGRGLDDYRFNEASNALYQFTWGTFCDWYLEFTKPILAGDDAGLADETRSTIRWTLRHILSLLNPIMPFLTEELWQRLALGSERPLMLEPWPDAPAVTADRDAGAQLDWVVRLIGAVRTVRAEMNVPPAHKITARLHHLDPAKAPWVQQWREVVCRMARLQDVIVSDADLAAMAERGVAQVLIDEATLALPLADAIDVSAEVERLRKSAAKVRSDIAAIDRKLDNPQFTAKAPQEVVEEQQDRRSAEAARLVQLEAAIGRLVPAG